MSYNILVVDDSSVMRRMVIKSLTMSGVPMGEVHQAANTHGCPAHLAESGSRSQADRRTSPGSGQAGRGQPLRSSSRSPTPTSSEVTPMVDRQARTRGRRGRWSSSVRRRGRSVAEGAHSRYQGRAIALPRPCIRVTPHGLSRSATHDSGAVRGTSLGAKL